MRHHLGMRVVIGALVSTALLALVLASAATPITSADALVRPGVGIGKLRLGMTLAQSRRALGQPLLLEQATRVSQGTLRLSRYESDNGLWQLALLGARGNEKLVSIGTTSRRERLPSGLGIGTIVSTIPERLSALDPKCVRGDAFINYRLVATGITTCAITTKGVLTIFVGEAECAVPPVRYQGCPEIRVPVATVAVEGPELTRLKLSAWDPNQTPSPLLP